MAPGFSIKGFSVVSNRKFLIPTLLVAGFSPPSGAQVLTATRATVEIRGDKASIAAISLFRQERPIQLAGHSSHRSHSSHSSHRSSSGGGYYTPAPLYSPLPPPARPSVRAPRSLGFLGVPDAIIPVEDGFTAIVKKVQTGLKAFGYYTGELDGQIGTETKLALSRMQTDYKLKVTGTITPEVLDALNIFM